MTNDFVGNKAYRSYTGVDPVRENGGQLILLIFKILHLDIILLYIFRVKCCEYGKIDSHIFVKKFI